MQSTLARGSRWVPFGVGQGYAGLSLLWGYLDRIRPTEGWDVVGHQHIEIAAQAAAAIHSNRQVCSPVSLVLLSQLNICRAVEHAISGYSPQRKHSGHL
jgi:hypothetical protein